MVYFLNLIWNINELGGYWYDTRIYDALHKQERLAWNSCKFFAWERGVRSKHEI